MPAARVPAVVMMHGRAGAYSSKAGGVFDASTLSQRHAMWGEFWAGTGYIAILVDGFGPRGHPQGFPRFSYEARPPELNEVTVRPLDAYGALAYLRARPDVLPDRIGLMGWSNGGSATLAALSADAPGIVAPTPATGFRAALAFYPACGLKGRFDGGYRPYAPVRVFHGTDDEEVSPRRCGSFVERSRALGGDIASDSTRAPPTASTIPAASASAFRPTPPPSRMPPSGPGASSRGSSGQRSVQCGEAALHRCVLTQLRRGGAVGSVQSRSARLHPTPRPALRPPLPPSGAPPAGRRAPAPALH
jgi:dienelactone hydrolase